MDNLLGQFNKIARQYPDRIALIDGDGRATRFCDLQLKGQKFAAAWQTKGIQRGDRVLLAMPVNADLYASLAALWSLGVVVVLPEPAMGLRGILQAIETIRPKAFCSAGWYSFLKLLLPGLWHVKGLSIKTGSMDPAAPLAGADPDERDIALISFTSGTTGPPKAIVRSHGFMMAQFLAVSPLLQSADVERDLVTFPVFALVNLASGRTTILPNWKMRRLTNLSAERLCAWIKTQNVTRALMPPSLCEKLSQGVIPPCLRRVFAGGGPVFPDIIAALHQAKPDLQIISVYGSTEAEPIAHLSDTDITETDQDAMHHGQGLLVGRPVECIDVRIRNDEILVAGNHVNKGYLNPEQDAQNKLHEDGAIWHRTGDAGFLDDKGRLWLLGKLGSDVQINGKRVYPFAIEIAARTWKGVQNCALVSDGRQPVLVLQGNASNAEIWRQNAKAIGNITIRQLEKIPMDRRHGSKTDRAALMRLLDN